MYGVPDELTARGTPHRDIIIHRMSIENYTGGFEEYCLENKFDPRETNGKLDYHFGGRCIEIHRAPIPDGGWVATHEDVTERRAAEAQVAYLASHDSLTELPNRTQFVEQLQSSVAQSKRGNCFALHTIDLDRFKEVNDTLGHCVGDELLKQVAARLRTAVREGDLVSRLGGDEFAVLQLNLSFPHEAATLAARLIEVLSEPYQFEEHSLVISATVGIAIAPRDATDGPELLKKSDLALYRAKVDNRRSVRFFEPGMDSAMQARRVLEEELGNALQKGEFELYYQPILRLSTGSISGFEALIRWHHPTRGILQPSEFISVAEETGIILPVGEWVLRRACQEAAGWPRGIRLSVNLSPLQFKRGDILSMVSSALTSAGLEPHRLELEVTESALLHDESWVRAILRQLRERGIGVAMDDFGTGYSSLSYLRSFPFSKIKIDRSFVSELTSRGDSLAIVQATVQLAAKLNMTTTAEGVETSEQLAIIRAEGCDEVQGYHISKPVPAHRVQHVISAISGGGSRAILRGITGGRG